MHRPRRAASVVESLPDCPQSFVTAISTARRRSPTPRRTPPSGEGRRATSTRQSLRRDIVGIGGDAPATASFCLDLDPDAGPSPRNRSPCGYSGCGLSTRVPHLRACSSSVTVMSSATVSLPSEATSHPGMSSEVISKSAGCHRDPFAAQVEHRLRRATRRRRYCSCENCAAVSAAICFMYLP